MNGGEREREGERERAQTRIGIKTSKREKKRRRWSERSISILKSKRPRAPRNPTTVLKFFFFFCLAATPHFATHAHDFAEVTYNIAYFFSNH